MKYLTFIVALLLAAPTFAGQNYDAIESREQLIDSGYMIADEFAQEAGVIVVTRLKCPLEKFDDGTFRVGAWTYTAMLDADGTHNPIALMCGDIVNITNDDNGIPHVPFITIPNGNVIMLPLGIFRKI